MTTGKTPKGSADYGLSGVTILDLPEPERSQALASNGMTADEFAAHMLGWQAGIAEKHAAIRSGDAPGLDGMHYDSSDDGVPSFAVVHRTRSD